MITDKIAELAKLRIQTEKLQAEVERESAAALAALPAQYGFSSVDDFVKAVLMASGKRGPRAKTKKAVIADRKKRAKRAVITPEMKAKVAELAKAGKTGTEIAKAVGISLPSVQNIKKAAGLVNKRK